MPFAQVVFSGSSVLRHEALDVEDQPMDEKDEGPATQQVLTGSERSSPCITTNSMRKKRRVIGNPLLRGTEDPIYQTATLLRDVCCLPGD